MQKAGSDPGLLLIKEEGRGHLKNCGAVNKEYGFLKINFEKHLQEYTCDGL